MDFEFVSENVTIEIQNSEVKVTGIYFFKNSSKYGKKVTFLYPFPVDSVHFFPDTIILDYPYTKDSAGIIFAQSFKATSYDSFVITYEQRVKHYQFRYITTTTQKWQKPIQNAFFTVVMPESLKTGINYTADSIRTMGDKRYFYIYEKEFYPQEDLVIRWSVIP